MTKAVNWSVPDHELRVEEESAFFRQVARNRRLLCPTPAREMTASRCSCCSRCQSDVWERRDTFFHAALLSLMAPRAALYLSLPMQHALPDRTSQWWDECRSRNSSDSGRWSNSSGSLLNPVLFRPRVRSWPGWWILWLSRRKLFGVQDPLSSCEEVPSVAVPVLFQRARKCRPLPKAATDVFIPRFC